jgi:hypothetical protein
MHEFSSNAFYTRVSAGAELDAISLQHILKRLIEDFLAFVSTDRERI